MKQPFLHITQSKRSLKGMFHMFIRKGMWHSQIKTVFIILVCFLYSVQMSYSQEDDGVVSLALPVRNSLKFNRFAINPTFSFVREQNRYVSVYNKREWVQFDDAPQTYLAGYSGRFAENIGAGVSLFQQNYGVLTTFGGVLNFAYNSRLNRDSNLTFGMNLGVYKSGLNTGKVVTNFTDPSLDNIPSNLLLTVNPGINYGTRFLDFGLSINNLVLYNIQSSELLQDDLRQTIQAHVMYTGYMYTSGFFDEAKFSGLLKTEVGKEDTSVSGIAMLTVPKGIWAQVGYNTLYGASAGIGLNITSQIAIEYNYEKAMGGLANFGSSHELTLAFKINKRSDYNYRDEEDVNALFSTENKRVLASNQPRMDPETRAELMAEAQARRNEIRERAQAKAATRAELAAEARVEQARKTEAKLAIENQKKQEEKDRISAASLLSAETAAKAKAEQEARLKLAAQEKAEADEKARIERQSEIVAASKLKEEQESKRRLALQEKAKADAKAQAEAQALLLAEAKAKADQAAKEKLIAQEKAKADAKAQAEAQALLMAEAKAKADQAATEKLIAQEKAKSDAKAQAEAQALLLAETKAKADQEAKEKLAAQVKMTPDATPALMPEATAQEEAQNQKSDKLLEEKSARLPSAATAVVLADTKKDTEARAEKLAEEKALENATDANAVSMKSLSDLTKTSKNAQDELLARFSDAVASRDQDLKDLKQENDLSDQGIYRAPKAFKSISEENNKMQAIRAELDDVIEKNTKRISDFENLYKERQKIPTFKNDEVSLYYKETIEKLKAEQLRAIQTRTQLNTTLNEIIEATEFERKRRIKRAAYTNEEDRYTQDRSALKLIKERTVLSPVALKSDDFDFGEEQSSNIQILKNIKNVQNGYYAVIAVHTDVAKRDAFLTKAVASGLSNIDFFYDVSTSKYFIYYKKMDSIEAASEVMESKGNQPYNTKIAIIKIEN